jgi:selenide,water dikinase
MKDLEKRRRVMERSIALGHCICDPKKPCPCDFLREKDVCLCAGERLEMPQGPVQLTHLVENAGCASKIDQATLQRVLAGLPNFDDPRVLVGVAAGDDAGVYQLDAGMALVQTVDVFCPSVDDPYLFGQVAAANSLSDVYAMGARPITALSILGFPVRSAPDQVMREILRGGIDKMAEAGVAVIGGHSIKDSEIKAGFAVTGLVDPKRIMTNDGARPGDVLVLTKALGTGIIAFADQIDRAPPGALEAAAKSMTALNKTASEVMLAFKVHACTDITGFGLVGHLATMASASGAAIEIVWDDLPLLPGVLECVGQGIIPGGVERNRESSAASVDLGKGVQPAMLDVCLDPQTSGGLLIVVAKRDAAALLERLHEAGVADAAVIGQVRGKGKGRIALKTRSTRPISEAPRKAAAAVAADDAACCSAEAESSCCSDGADIQAEAEEERSMKPKPGGAACCSEGHGAAATQARGAAGTSEVRKKFHDFLRAAGAPGALDARTKQAMAVALSVLAKCEPCTRNHIREARDMGFSDAEIDEAVWMAIAFGGSPVMMFYEGVKRA